MRRTLYVITSLFLTLIMGCGGPPPSGQKCFRWSTGLDLPAGVKCLNSKVITVALVGDTYYLKLKSDHDLLSFLAGNFDPDSWSVVKDQLIPPSDWSSDLPFWNKEELEGKAYYSKTYRSTDGNLFYSVLSYDTKSGTVYFVGGQCRD